MKKNLNIPISYSIDNFDSDRFLKLRVKVMHSGLNLNNSNFNLEAIEKAQGTLSNIPILAFVKKVDGESNEDFAGHEFELKITENDFKFVYLGRPIGIVPESNNYSVEVDETGRSFVYADAYIWKDYANSALDIINRDGVKKVSMEIIVKEYDWKDNYVDILDYSYTGITMLGEDVKEAMIGAKAEVINFSATTISEMMTELKNELDKINAEDFSEEEKEEEFTEDFEAKESEEDENNSTEEDETEESFEEENEDFTEDEDSSEEEFSEINKEEFSEEEKEEEIDIEALKQQLTALETENQSLKNDLKILQDFKAEIDKKDKEIQIENLFDQFEDLDEEELAPIKEKAFSSDLSLIELELYALRGKKVKVEPSNKKMFTGTDFNSKDKMQPIYADLIRQTKKTWEE